ncbi:hypothetical protein EMCRGX_G010317 [Ephydatia muelleri]
MALECADTFLFTSESVGEGHPDKMCDQISDAILDECLRSDPESKVACECAAKDNVVILVGEVTTKAQVDFKKVVCDTAQRIGYDDISKGFDYRSCTVINLLSKQSPDIAQAVYENKAAEQLGAGDQGLMFGYATDETREMIPLSLLLAHNMNRRLAELRRNGAFPWAGPDSKSQVTVEYRREGGACVPLRVHTVVMSVQHKEDTPLEEMRVALRDQVAKAVIPTCYHDNSTLYLMQPSGKFVVGGPTGDAGVTGRKTVVDAYGGWGSSGGGAFSGKDGSKVDRSASYAARWIAKSLVCAGLARRVSVQVSYAIGVPRPLSLYVDSYGTSAKTDKELERIVESNFDLRPGIIVQDLKLKDPIFQRTACYGHFGRPEFPWETPKGIVI